jgi:hypothetical protein
MTLALTAPGRVRMLAAIVVISIVGLAGLLIVGGASVALAAPRFDVDATVDEPDAAADGVCAASPSGRCTLRAAIQEVENLGSGQIVLPPGVFVLDRVEVALGGHETARGDLDIRADATITGAGADRTVIDGDSRDRVFDIFNGADVRISRVSLRNARATFSFPTHHRHGAAIHNHGKLTLVDSTISDSVANAGSPWGGGGLTNAGNGEARLENVTIARNSTTFRGGGIENGGKLDLFNVTLSENTAPIGWGGAISSGTGFFGASSTARARINNTVVDGNNPGADNNCDDRLSVPTIVSLGHNLESGHFCRFRTTGDREDTHAGLLEIANDAGTIFVYGLAPGSAAIDAGSGPFSSTTDVGCMATDERGRPRPVDGNGDGSAVCDIGAFELERTLKLTSAHMRGDDVRWVELRLNFHGAGPLTVDGDYGPATAAAVRRFQAHRGLPVTGQVGTQTYDALAAAPRTLKLTTPHMRGRDVRWVELRLNVHGAGPVRVDGDYGPATAAAVRRFQADRGLPVTGEVDLGLYEALAAAP